MNAFRDRRTATMMALAWVSFAAYLLTSHAVRAWLTSIGDLAERVGSLL